MRERRLGPLMLILLVLAVTSGAKGSPWDSASPFELTLTSAIARALDMSPQLALAQLEAERAQLDFRSTRRMVEDMGEVSTYPLALIKYLYPERSRSHLLLARQRVQAVRANLELQVRSAYSGVLLAQELAKVAALAVTTALEQAQLAQALYQNGTVPHQDVIKARVSQAEAQAGLVSAHKQVELAQLALSRVIGLPLDGRLVLEPTVTLLEVDLPPLTQQIQQGLADRFERRESWEAVRLAYLNRSLAYAYPAAPGWPEWWGEWPEEWVRPPWFPGPNQEAARDAEATELNQQDADLQYQQAIIYHRLSQDEVELQIRQSLLEVKETAQRRDSYSLGLQAAEEGLRLAQLRYQAGVGTNLETLAAALARSQAQVSLAAACFDHQLAQATYLHRASLGFVFTPTMGR